MRLKYVAVAVLGTLGLAGFSSNARAAGTAMSFDVPGSVFTTAYGVNSRAQVVGEYWDASYVETWRVKSSVASSA